MLASINAAADAYVWADEDYKGRVRTAAIKLGGWALALLEDQADDDVERPHPTKPWVISSNPHMSRW
jgi:hypothetical protein